MKVSIIGGGGRVGSDAAFALQLGGIVNEMVLVDANADLAAGEALDLRHGSALSSSQKIHAGDYDAVNGSDCVVITAGLRRKPDESRLELINRNVILFRQILDSLKGVKPKPVSFPRLRLLDSALCSTLADSGLSWPTTTMSVPRTCML
jgi:L-lactate dehydrogenase